MLQGKTLSFQYNFKFKGMHIGITNIGNILVFMD